MRRMTRPCRPFLQLGHDFGLEHIGPALTPIFPRKEIVPGTPTRGGAIEHGAVLPGRDLRTRLGQRPVAIAIAGEIILISRYAGQVDVRRVTVVQLATASLLSFLMIVPTQERIPDFSWLLLASALALLGACSMLEPRYERPAAPGSGVTGPSSCVRPTHHQAMAGNKASTRKAKNRVVMRNSESSII